MEKNKIGKRNRQRGISYELKIIKELREISKNENLCSSRSESKKLDDYKIDIFDKDKVLPFYCQIKATQSIPQVKKINEEVGLNFLFQIFQTLSHSNALVDFPAPSAFSGHSL